MTKNEAIELYKNRVIKTHYKPIGGTIEECQEALEKQMPKKVLNKKALKDFEGKIYSFRGNCPCCNMEELMSVNTRYCPQCGQKLDWKSE